MSEAKPINESETLSALFAAHVAATPDREAYREYDESNRSWVSLTWQQIGFRVARCRAALLHSGIGFGDRVAILLPNGIDTVAIDQAVLAIGAVPVPMHALDNPRSIAYILQDSGARALFLDQDLQWNQIAATGESMPDLTVVVTAKGDHGDSTSAPSRVVGFENWQAAGQPESDVAPRRPGADDLAGIVYTSGTTGKPKGVMLTHRNIVANLRSVLERAPANGDDVFLSFLPLSHTFERTAGYYLPIAAGACVAYARSVAHIPDDLKEIRPTILVSVPRIYERFYAKIGEAQLRSNRLLQALFRTAVEVGWRRFANRQGFANSGPFRRLADAAVWPVLERLVAARILALFGGRLRVAVSGGAALPPAVARCFIGLGVPLLQGYGMTESSPVISANALHDNWPGTVGRPLSGVEVRIGENAEIQVRGANIMLGYWKRPEDSQRALMEGGWLRTGDQGAIEDGRIRILGRIKEIIVTSTGEKIAPADLEMAIEADSLFEQVFVVGENRPFIAAFVVLQPENWKQSFPENGQPSQQSINTTAAHQALLARIRAATDGFPHYAVPRAVFATLEPWTTQNGLMTPTLKLKRNNLLSYYASNIAAVYDRRETVSATTLSGQD